MSIASISALLLPNLNPSHQSAYADSLTSDLKDEIKQHMGQDSLCLRQGDCKQANEGQR